MGLYANLPLGQINPLIRKKKRNQQKRVKDATVLLKRVIGVSSRAM